MLKQLKAALFGGKSECEPANEEYDRYFKNFQYVLDREHLEIERRRNALRRPSPPWPQVDDNKKGGAKRPMYQSAGISLSGGGIRSAAFCLGALQSLGLDNKNLFNRLDYLSTVSGGGYIGSSLSAAMATKDATAPQPFPFAERGRFDDEPSLGHIRDYSNYILPRGQKSLGEAVAVVLRGLATNAIIVLAFVFVAAAFTVFAYPDTTSLWHGSFLARLFFARWWGDSWIALFGDGPFALTLRLFIALAIYMGGWALLRSRSRGEGSDVRGQAIVLGRKFIVLLLISAALDLQPLAIWGLSSLKSNSWSHFVEGLSAVAAPFAGVVAFFSSRLAAILKQSSRKPGTAALIARLTSQGLILMASAILPLLLWLFYLWICAVAIPQTGFHFPKPLQAAFDWPTTRFGMGICWTYLIVGFVFMMLVRGLGGNPNANSLHQLYRDKLSKAFLFDPDYRYTKNAGSADDQDLVPRDRIALDAISPPTGGPYHLVNATVNLQGSVQANRRGRGASFFLFSSQFTGSDVTGYVETPTLQKHDPHIDLGSAMAISGAAISSDMGSESVAPLAPTLALLNLRLGYWMDNPRYMPQKPPYPPVQFAKDKRPTFWSRFYLLSEMFGRLDETAPKVYLTDGGHIENLGLYELLKRHCSVIFVVDGEADPQLSFHALSIAERYARIDLGVRIDLPWSKIAQVANAATKCAENGKPIPRVGGPHCAVGTILYPGDEKDRGLLVYVKASLTGDEPDYVVDYKTRNPAFPHESTGDQFFTEEQFEVYRALGFHALDGFLSGSRDFDCNVDVALAAAFSGKTVPEFVKDSFPPGSVPPA